MPNKIHNLFSSKYANGSAIDCNCLMLLLYKLTFPFSFVLHKFGISPNQTTFASLFFSLLAFLAISFSPSRNLFFWFWLMSIIFDFCDGTVARMSLRIGRTEFRCDHMSDLFKIALIILGIGLRYDQLTVWALVVSAVFVFIYRDLLSYQLDFARWKYSLVSDNLPLASLDKVPPLRLRARFKFAAWIVNHENLLKIVKNFYNVFFTIHGHTLFIFLAAPFGLDYACYILLYFISLNLFGIFGNIFRLMKMQRL